MRRKVDLIILGFVLVFGALALLNAQKIGDLAHSLFYHPPTEISQLADEAGMNDLGTKYFYRYSPQIVDQQALDENCDVEKLGCTQGRHIYILKANNDSENNRNIVTAAHEMLHVAYSRLSEKEQEGLQQPLDEELAKPEAARILESLKNYPQEDYYNEAHSFIGSQISDPGPTLSAYYKKYFYQRSKTTDAYKASPENWIF